MLIDGLVYFFAVIGASVFVPFLTFLTVRMGTYGYLSAKHKFTKRHGDPATAASLNDDLRNHWN